MSTVLTIDDSKVVRTMVARHLQPYGCTVVEAQNGVEGLEAARQHRPDLILLDVTMPVMDGRQCLAELRKDGTAAARCLETEYRDALDHARCGRDPHETDANVLRRRVVPVARRALDDLRRVGTVGDDAYRRVEEELDWLELSAEPVPPPRRS